MFVNVASVDSAGVFVQTSEGSPHSPPPAVIVVSDSPACVRKSESRTCTVLFITVAMVLCRSIPPG